MDKIRQKARVVVLQKYVLKEGGKMYQKDWVRVEL
jgi:hypothetical protein